MCDMWRAVCVEKAAVIIHGLLAVSVLKCFQAAGQPASIFLV